MHIKNKDYLRGIAAEARVIQRLRDAEFLVSESTVEENKYQDIDCYVGSTPISIKSQPIAATSGFIQMECYVKRVVRCRKPYSTNARDYDYKWQPSWFHTGKAKVYLIDIEEGVLYVDKQALIKAVDSGQVAVRQIKGNRKSTVIKQMKSGHIHHDAKSVLIKIEDILSYGIGFWMELKVKRYDIGGIV